jgi:hypothetical protein
LNVSVSLTPERPAEVISLRVRSRTRGPRRHQIAIRRDEPCRGATQRSGRDCGVVPDVLYRIEVDGKAPPPARAFEATPGCWYGSCPVRCYTLAADGDKVAAAAPSCDRAMAYVILDCAAAGEACEQRVGVRLLLGDPRSSSSVPLSVTFSAIGEDAPVTAEIVRD